MKLTVEEIKKLPVGDWIWVVALSNRGSQYFQICYREQGIVFEGKNYCIVPDFSGYNKDWIAYKNKEQAEEDKK